MDKPLWGLRVLKFDGAIAPRVLRFDAPPARGLWWAPYIYRRRPLMIKPNNRAFARGKTIQPPCGRRKCIPPLVAGTTTLPGGKHVTGFAGRLQLPYESSSFATPTSRGHYKTPLCCELIMKGLLFRALLSPVEVLHRTSKWGELRRLACPLRRFPFVAPPNCGGGKGTGFIGEL